MKQADHYSDEALQAYWDGRFNGDAAALENHLAGCPHCSAGLLAYREIAAFARNSWPEPGLSIDLAQTVGDKVFAPLRRARRAERLLYGGFLILALALLVWCIRLLAGAPPAMLLLLVPVAVYVALSWKEQSLLRRFSEAGQDGKF